MGNINKNGAMFLLALGLASQVPTTIEKIPDATAKSLIQLLAVLCLLWAGMKIDLRRGFSDPPPKPKGDMKGTDYDPSKEPDTLRESRRKP